MAEHPASLDFLTFDRRAAHGATLSVVFLGGSLTWGAQSTNPQETSYRALIGKRLQAAYPKARFQFWDAAIGGTGSQLAAFRLDRDVLSKNPDLVFLDFTVNDDAYAAPAPSRLSSYESVVRRLVQAGIPVVQVILPVKRDALGGPPSRPLDAAHKEIASAYSLPVADAVSLLKHRVTQNLATPDELWDLPEDITHPGDAGYALYAEAAWEAFRRAVSSGQTCLLPEKMLHASTYMQVTRFRLSRISPLPEGWNPGRPHRNATAYDFICSRWMEDLIICRAGSAPLLLRVQASDILLFGEMTMSSGNFRVRIDGGAEQTLSARCAEGNMRLVKILAEGLDAGREHLIEVIPELESGQELRIESLCAAGGPASVVPVEAPA